MLLWAQDMNNLNCAGRLNKSKHEDQYMHVILRFILRKAVMSQS